MNVAETRRAGLFSGQKRGLVILIIFVVGVLTLAAGDAGRDREAPRVVMTLFSGGDHRYELRQGLTGETIRPATKAEYQWQQSKHLWIGGLMVVLIFGVALFPAGLNRKNPE